MKPCLPLRPIAPIQKGVPTKTLGAHSRSQSRGESPHHAFLSGSLGGFRILVAILVAHFGSVFSAGAIELVSSSLPPGQTLQILTGSVSYQVVVRGTDGELNTPYSAIVYVQGTDIYGNQLYIEVERREFTLSGQRTILNPGGTSTVEPPTTATIGGPDARWIVPDDGTLHNITSGYRLTVAIYSNPPSFPTTLAGLGTGRVIFLQSGQLNIDVLPDLAIASQAAVTYRAGSYRGGDVIPFTVNWENDARGEGDRQSRPLKWARESVNDETDSYVCDLRLSNNPEFGGANNDDFLLSRLRFRADVPAVPDGTTVLRSVTVGGTPGPVPPYGLTGVVGSQRVYTPQPDDGFLDIGETVAVELDTLIPKNFSNPNGYFVAARVTMLDPNEDAASNNTFVSNSANKIAILATDEPTLEASSVISDQNGEYIWSGNRASDFSSVSEEGNLIAFASRAANLLMPPEMAAEFIDLYGPSADPSDPATYTGNLTFSMAQPFLTAGQQIFVKYRQSRENLLVSANLAGTQANAECFNPFISADGAQVAYDSRATNLGAAGTGGRSMIYVYNIAENTTALVSKNSAGIPANGDSFNPRLSQSGRFVTFESVARNLDASRPLPSNNRNMQVYLHDRDVDGNGVFDEPGGIATYLVSINPSGQVANGWCNNAVVNLNDTPADMAVQGGMFVAFSSYARNMPLGTGYSTVYRVTVEPGVGPIAASVVAVSVNDIGAAPAAVGVDPVGAFIRPDCDEAAINGDGTQIAFTSYANNFVLNSVDGTFTPTFPNGQPNNPAAPVDPNLLPAGDYNRVPDIFVRDLNASKTIRVSVSEPRVATGTITFLAAAFRPSPLPGGTGTPPGNVPVNQPTAGQSITLNDGINPPLTLVFGTDVAIGASVFETRNNLVNAINSAGLELFARPTTPPDTAVPGTAYAASIYVRNLIPGAQGNRAMVTDSPVIDLAGMSGGGIQAEEDAIVPGNTNVAPIQGVPFGSNQPSIDRIGRRVAFRTIATNLDVHRRTDQNNYEGSPVTGELIRPLVFATSNVYLHDRDENETGAFDTPGNLRTHRISVNRFGYKTSVDGSQVSGLEATFSANSSLPALSANGRFISFSSDSSGEGGLIFGPNNLTPLDNSNVRDVFISDQQVTGVNPIAPDTLPSVTIVSPPNGLRVLPGTQITVSALAESKGRSAVSSAECFVNGESLGILTATPLEWTFAADPAGSYTVQVFATDNRGREGSSFVTVNAAQPMVPANPPVGSNEKFVVDYFNRIFLRQPSYAEYETYLNQLSAGVSQAQVIVNMMQSPSFASAANVLYGYYLRMGLTPAGTNALKNQLFTMTNGTNATLLTNAFAPMDLASGPVPYGATIGQAKVAEELIGSISYAWSNSTVANLDDNGFVAWMQRSFNEPYLTNTLTGPVLTVGSSSTVLSNVINVPSPGGPLNRGSRFGHNYAYLSAFYSAAYAAGRVQNGLNNVLADFNGDVQGIAVRYLLTSPNTWATNTPPLSTNLVQTLLPPVITNTGTNNVTVNTDFTNVVGGQNLLSNTFYSYVAPGLPSSVTVSTNSGQMVISGRFTNTGTFPITLVASNGPGLVGSNRVVYMAVPAAPALERTTVSGSVGTPLRRTIASFDTPTLFSISALPAGVSLNTTTGLLLGVPLDGGVLQTTVTARNAGGATQASLTFDISHPSPMTEWLVGQGLVGSDSLPGSDPDNDGHSNTVEFAFGMRPDSADDIPARYEYPSNQTVIYWTRRIGTSEVVYKVQQSTSLSTPEWTEVPGATPVVVPPEGGVSLPAGYERVKVSIPRPSGTPALFYRVTATLTPEATAAP